MQLTPPSLPPDVLPLWTAGTAVATTTIVQLLKKFITPLHNAPDSIKAGFALVVAIVATLLGHLVGGPLPTDLAGAVGVVVTWLASAGLHSLGKKVGVITDSVPA